MESNTFKKRTENVLPKFRYTIDYNMRDYSKDPFFVKKRESAQRSLAEKGIPDMTFFKERQEQQ